MPHSETEAPGWVTREKQEPVLDPIMEQGQMSPAVPGRKLRGDNLPGMHAPNPAPSQHHQKIKRKRSQHCRASLEGGRTVTAPRS
jgi:hypothetical protein